MSTTTATTTLRSTAREPRQARTHRVLERIVGATRELLQEGQFDSVTVADIARRAGVSVGTVYQRFASKEHLLVHVARDVISSLAAQAQRELAAPAADTIQGIALQYFTVGERVFRTQRALLAPLATIVRTTRDAALRTVIGGFNEAVHQMLRERVLAHRAKIRHSDPEAAVNFAILVGSSALREIVLFGEPVSRLTQRRVDAVNEIARSFAAYLVCPARLLS